MAKYIIELETGNTNINPFVEYRIKHITEKEYESLDEGVNAIKLAGSINVPYLDEAIRARIPIEIKEWSIYQNTPYHRIGRIRQISP